jgi:hypothetical protein
MSVEVELLKGPAKGQKKVLSDARARAFVQIGYAKVVVPEPAKPARKAKPEPEPVVESAGVPEKAAETTAEPQPAISPRTGLPVRQYTRRDMTAEDN